jgi:F0F1-type ATP synthase membrane subunit a
LLHPQDLAGLFGGALPAYAAEGGAAQQQGSWMSILPFVVIMLGFFFFTSRSQKKKQKEHEKMLQMCVEYLMELILFYEIKYLHFHDL